MDGKRLEGASEEARKEEINEIHTYITNELTSGWMDA